MEAMHFYNFTKEWQIERKLQPEIAGGENTVPLKFRKNLWETLIVKLILEL